MNSGFGLGSFPATRMRRNRANGWTRRLVAENRLSVDDLIWPIFIMEGSGQTSEIAAMPGVLRVSVDRLAWHVEEAAKLNFTTLPLAFW